MRSSKLFKMCLTLSISALAIHQQASSSAAQSAGCSSAHEGAAVSANFGDSAPQAFAAPGCGCDSPCNGACDSGCGNGQPCGHQGSGLLSGRLRSNLMGRLRGSDCGCGQATDCGGCDGGCAGGGCAGGGCAGGGCAGGGCAGGGCDGGGCDGGGCDGGGCDGGCAGCDGGSSSSPFRSRLFLRNPISRGPATGIGLTSRGPQCNGDGCDGCRGGLFSELGSGRIANGMTGRAANVGSRLRSIGNGGLTGAGGCDQCAGGQGWGNGGLASRGNANGFGGMGFGGWNANGSGGMGSGGWNANGSGGMGSGGWNGNGTSGLLSRLGSVGSNGLGSRFGAAGSADCEDCGMGLGQGALANRLNGNGGILGGGNMNDCGGAGCGNCQVCSGLLARGMTAARGIVGPARGDIPHTSQPPYGDGMGQQAPAYGYPYYTARAPRDFLMDNPPSIGW